MTAELPAGMRGELAGVLQTALYAPTCHNGHVFTSGVCEDGSLDPRWCDTCGEARHLAATDALAPLIAGWLAAAEQRGREDNSDHGMCYVHGSKALEALIRQAKAEALRLPRAVEAAMSDQAADAWRSADARRGLSDHDALLVHADALTRWSERLRMAFDGEDWRDE